MRKLNRREWDDMYDQYREFEEHRSLNKAKADTGAGCLIFLFFLVAVFCYQYSPYISVGAIALGGVLAALKELSSLFDNHDHFM